MTPIGTSLNVRHDGRQLLLVYSAGNHRFNDFLRAGAPLTIIMWLALSWLLPRFYPLTPGG